MAKQEIEQEPVEKPEEEPEGEVPLTLEEIEELKKLSEGFSTSGDGKHSVHSFLHAVAVAEDTTKTGNLTADEVGVPKLPERTLKELALFCGEVGGMEYFSDYFNKKAEILTSTSLSKDAKLINLAVVQKKEFSDASEQPKKENKGWFKKKNKPLEIQGG